MAMTNQQTAAPKAAEQKAAPKGKDAKRRKNDLDYEKLGLDPTVYGKKRKPKGKGK